MSDTPQQHTLDESEITTHLADCDCDESRVLLCLYCTPGDHTIQGIFTWLYFRGYELGGDRIKDAVDGLIEKGFVGKGPG